MTVGTKSMLFGVHCFLLHPFFVAAAWWRLYGFPWDLRLWVAFFVHDVGYFGKPNMDGPEGETHPFRGASIMHYLFDYYDLDYAMQRSFEWYHFCLYHSRYYAKRNGAPFSKLCVADKLAIVLTPSWLYLPLACMSGEIHEYIVLTAAKGAKYSGERQFTGDYRLWLYRLKENVLRWVEEHKDGREDTWTPSREAN